MSAQKKRLKSVARKKPAAPEHRHNLFDADLLHPHGAPRVMFEKPLPPLPVPPKKTASDHIKGFLLRPEKKEQPLVERKKESGVSLAERFAKRQKAKGPAVTKEPTPVVVNVPPKESRFKNFFFRPSHAPEKKELSKDKPVPEATPIAHNAPVVKERKTVKHAPEKTIVETKPAVVATPVATKPAAKSSPHPFRLSKPKKEKAPRKRLQRKSLQEYLDKAGFSVQAELVRKRLFQGLLVVFLAISAYVLLEAGKWGTGALDVLIFMAGLWTAGFFGAFLAAQGAVYFFLDYRIFTRTREIEAVLPDFLQLASSNIAAGMPIDRALWLSIRPSFGVLAKEMEIVAKSTMAGESLEGSLLRFADAYESPILKRSVAILIEGLRAGGEMADLLNKIALNIEELKIMRQEMAANVTTYAIFITFASVMVAPFLFALATQLLEIIIGITGSLDLSSSGSFFTINAADPHVVERFKTFSIVMLAVSTAFSAALVSVIKRGNVFEGIKSIPLYAIGAVVIYYLSLSMLHGMFGGILTGG